MIDFAPEFKRDENGWILFPRDVQERKMLFFPDEVMKHPAKMNFHLQQSIIEYVAKPGETLMDIFGGTGTLMIAALQGYHVILIEVEDGYHKLQMEAKNNLEIQSGYGNMVIVDHGKGWATCYAHNSRNLVRQNQKVHAGDVVARVGESGRATGPHLHFEVRRNYEAIDPMPLLP